MKNCLLALFTALLLTSCAGVRVCNTDVATGAVNPRAIYIRPFDITAAEFEGRHGNTGEREIRRSLAPREFAQMLKEELETIAPARILEEDETAPTGWLVEGQFDVVHSGSPSLRFFSGLTGFGRSRVNLHVRVIEVGRRTTAVTKNSASALTSVSHTTEGRVVYEFDLCGGSEASGKYGTLNAPGVGYAVPFDFRNAAERVKMVLSPDPHRYGLRTSPTVR